MIKTAIAREVYTQSQSLSYSKVYTKPLEAFLKSKLHKVTVNSFTVNTVNTSEELLDLNLAHRIQFGFVDTKEMFNELSLGGETLG